MQHICITVIWSSRSVVPVRLYAARSLRVFLSGFYIGHSALLDFAANKRTVRTPDSHDKHAPELIGTCCGMTVDASDWRKHSLLYTMHVYQVLPCVDANCTQQPRQLFCMAVCQGVRLRVAALSGQPVARTD